MTRSLELEYRPRVVSLELPVDSEMIDEAEQELVEKAHTTEDGCWGYYPSIQASPEAGENTQLPANEALAQAIPTIWAADRPMEFSFTRATVRPQPLPKTYHLDASPDTGIMRHRRDLHEETNIPRNEIWRLLLNLNMESERRLSYLELAVDGLYWRVIQDAVQLPMSQRIPIDTAGAVTIPPRSAETVHGALFCASRVPHRGVNNTSHSFVAAYSYEQLKA